MEGEQTALGEQLRDIQSRLARVEERIESLEGARRGATPRQVKKEEEEAVPSEKPGVGGIRGMHREWETAIGGTWLNRIGVLAFVFGVAFFLKYAFDNDWIGPLGRVILGSSAGLVFLAGGEYLMHRKYTRVAQGLIGGGIAILYLSLFAAFNFYSILSAPVTFALMIQVTLVSIVLAVKDNSRSIAFLGVLGGFLTPVLLGTGGGGSAVLLSYILLLDLGILGVAYFRKWVFLNYMGFIGSYLYLLPGLGPLGFGSRILFLTLFFLVFTAVPFLFSVANRVPVKARDMVMISLNTIIFFVALYNVLSRDHYIWLGALPLVLGVFYLGLNSLIARWHRGDFHLRTLFLTISLVAFILAVPIQLPRHHWVTVAWSLQLVALYWQGLNLRLYTLRVLSYLLLLVAALNQMVHLIDGAYWYVSDYPFMNWEFLVSLFLVASVFALAFLGARLDPGVLGKGEKSLVTAFGMGGNLLLLGLLSREITLYFDYRASHSPREYWAQVYSTKQVFLSALWAAYSVVLVIAGIIKRSQPTRLLAMALFGITIGKVFLVDLSNLEPLFRVIAFVGLGAVLIGVSFLYQKRGGSLGPEKGVERGDE